MFGRSFRATPAFMSACLHAGIVLFFLVGAAPVIKVDLPVAVEIWDALPSSTTQVQESQSDSSSSEETQMLSEESNPSVSQNTASTTQDAAIQLKQKPEKPELLDREDRETNVDDHRASEQKVAKPLWLREKPKDPSKLLSRLDTNSAKYVDQVSNEGQNGGGTDTSYLAKLRVHILRHIYYSVPPDLRGDPVAIFSIEQSAKGDVIAINLKKSSGLAGYDEAVSRAIEKSSPLPIQKDGSVVSPIELRFRPKDNQ
jgi:colicin import membrane protein